VFKHPTNSSLQLPISISIRITYEHICSHEENVISSVSSVFPVLQELDHKQLFSSGIGITKVSRTPAVGQEHFKWEQLCTGNLHFQSKNNCTLWI